MIVRPTLSNYARSASRSAYPALWNGLAYGWDLELGPQGLYYPPVVGSRGMNLVAAGYTNNQALSGATFNGTSSTGATSTTLDLTYTNKITVAWCMTWTAFNNDDDLAWESSANFNSNAGAILCDPNESAVAQFVIVVRNAAANGNGGKRFDRSSAGVPHHYFVTFDLDDATNWVPSIFVDGAVPAGVAAVASNQTTGEAANFGAYSWYFMCRAAASLFGAGTLHYFYLYDRLLSQAHAIDFRDGKRPVTPRAWESPVWVAVAAAPPTTNRRRRLLMAA